jgi:hypothetical protein
MDVDVLPGLPICRNGRLPDLQKINVFGKRLFTNNLEHGAMSLPKDCDECIIVVARKRRRHTIYHLARALQSVVFKTVENTTLQQPGC